MQKSRNSVAGSKVGRFKWVFYSLQKSSRGRFKWVAGLSEWLLYIILRFSENFQKFPNFFKKISLQLFLDFFHLEKKILEKIFSPMSIRNFPLIPKIILRKSADQAKCEKIHFPNWQSLFVRISRIFTLLKNPYRISRFWKKSKHFQKKIETLFFDKIFSSRKCFQKYFSNT